MATNQSEYHYLFKVVLVGKLLSNFKEIPVLANPVL